ncbi:hypothetical protein PS9374_05714 [Planomonospora sphaerica]|uniref:Uncharacterized protein n=1 Tax=Planomonospora sphaerica TaxID=161355 RepID=A0A161LKX8_9ACTN|nr:hypothetical protein PS9374_05714 [Planomonospora sphaerica]
MPSFAFTAREESAVDGEPAAGEGSAAPAGRGAGESSLRAASLRAASLRAASLRAASIAATVARSRGRACSRRPVTSCLLVWLTTLAAQTTLPSGSRTGSATATSPGSTSWSSSAHGAAGSRRARPAAQRAAGSVSPTRKVIDRARRRGNWATNRTSSPSGTASETDSSSSSASRRACGPSARGSPLQVR